MASVRCECGRAKRTLASARCDECARAARRKARPLCACGCGEPVGRADWTYASVACLKRMEYVAYVARWKAGQESGIRGLGVSNHIRRHLVETRGERCEVCGWAARNPHTGNIPLTVDHADGNWENNAEANLRLLCPNCHSLTATYAGANRGNGRKARGANRYELSRDG